MNLPRPTRTTAIISLCLVILAGIMGYEHNQLSQLSTSLAATADKESLDALLTRLGKIDERLDTVAGKNLVTNEDFRAGQQALSNRIDAAQAYAKKATESGVSVFLCSGWLGPAVRQALVLPARSGKSVSVQDRKLIHCHFPVVCRMTPVGGDVAQPKPYQFRRGLIGREVPSSLDDLA